MTEEDPPLRVIVVSHDSFWPLKGGGGLRVYWVVKSLVNRGHDVVVTAPLESTQGLEDSFPGLNLLNLGKVTRFTRKKEFNYLKLMIKIFTRLWREEADVIYAHNFVAALPSYLVGRTRGIPLVFDMDDLMTGLSEYKMVSRWAPRLEFLLARKTDRLIVMSKALEEEAKKLGAKTSIECIPHGVNLALFKPTEATKDSSILFIGGIEKHDGVTLIPLAAKKVISVFPEIKFVIIGQGRDLPLVKKLVVENNLTSSFEFQDWVDHEEVPRYVAKARIGLVTHLKSLATDIALVLKGLEFMAMETPIIVPDLRGMREEVGNNERGLTFSCGNRDDLAEKIIFLLKRPEMQEQMGKNGRMYVEAKHNWMTNASKIVDVCEKILSV